MHIPRLPVAPVAALVAAVAYPATAVGQPVIRISEGEVCAECRIEIERIATLHPPSERVRFVVLPRPDIARDSQGRYVVGLTLGEAPLTVFESSGTFSHSFGSFARFTQSGLVVQVGAGDTIHVFQGTRHHVLSPASGEFVRSRQIQVSPWDVTLLESTMVANAPVGAPRGRSTAVQVLGSDGRVLRGIGQPVVAPPNAASFARSIAREAARAGVWSAYWTRYELGRFTLEGEEEMRVVREVPWFPPTDEWLSGEGYTTQARPKIEGLREPTEGTLWVAISHGDPAYEPPQESESDGIEIDPYQDDNGRLDTVLEVLSLCDGDGLVLATAEFDPHLRFANTTDDGPVLYSMRTLTTREVVADVWRAHLRMPQGKSPCH